jgi:hypothetical protein
VDSRTKEEEVIFSEEPPIEDAGRMFGFELISVNLNYINDELRAQLPPCDTRLRGDQRLFEQGQVDEADEEKIRLEVKQRKARKEREEAGIEWTPNFFRECPHDYIPGQKQYKFI